METNLTSMIGQGSRIGSSEPGAGDSPERLMQVAREFEAIIIHQLLQQMREASSWTDDEQGELFGSRLMETIDVELARQLALGGGLGLAEKLFPSLAGGDGAAPSAPVPEVVAATLSTRAALVTQPSAPAVSSASVPGVTSDFGWRPDPIAGDHRFHAGVDFRAAYGHEVGAAQAGRVVDAGERGGYGLTVVIEHRPGVQTRYAHLSAILVEPGQRVSAREPIGRAGQTGRATGTHLHFEVTIDGEPIDPARIKGGIDGLLKDLRLAAETASSRT